MKIGIFGGSFNPPHVGHLLACQYVLATNDLDEIWVVPVKEHPFGKPLLDFWQRYELCCIMYRHNPRIRVMSFDHKFTIDLLKDLIEKWSFMHSFSLIVGSDICNEWTEWKDHDMIKEIVPIIVVQRRGHAGDNFCAVPAVSSTEIRRRLKYKKDVSHLVPRKVLEYIKHNNLEFEYDE